MLRFEVKTEHGFFNEDFLTYAAAVAYLTEVVDGFQASAGRVVFNGVTLLSRKV